MKKILSTALFICVCALAYAHEVTYQIMSYDADAADFVLKTYGEHPVGSMAFFENDYGATYGNRYNQIPRNRYASLYLVGWEGCTIDSVTLSMCSNNSSGTAKLLVQTQAYEGDSLTGTTVLHTMAAAEFASDSWFGEWLSKDQYVYADITKVMQVQHMVAENEELEIRLAGGTAEGSVYLHRITVYYSAATGVQTESPMGYRYTKLEAKSTLNDLDTVILYRSGSAAGDIDGMETSHYLDAIGVHSTSDVQENYVTHFVLHRGSANNWHMVTLEGDTLGAAGRQNLCWNGGVMTWNITLGYNGATVSSTNSNYGTLRYNAPSGSYPRFWNYTSTTLSLPYLYRRNGQNQPVVATAVSLSENYRTVVLPKDTVMLRASVLPTNVTDERVYWLSSDSSVATVRAGVVHPKQAGTAVISCYTWDGLQSATCTLVLTSGGATDLAEADAEEKTVVLYTPMGICVFEGTQSEVVAYMQAHPQQAWIRKEKQTSLAGR